MMTTGEHEMGLNRCWFRTIALTIAAALFVPAMGLFRRVRDHYVAIQFVSGLILVSLGVLLFAGEFWRLRVYLNRIVEALG